MRRPFAILARGAQLWKSTISAAVTLFVWLLDP
jgi:hypothetical protein